MADTGFGISISFSSGFLAEIIDVPTLPSPSRDSIETSHTGTSGGLRTYILQDLADPGELVVELNFDEDVDPPISDDFETVTITFGSGTTWEFQGALMSYEPSAPIDDRMTATATIKVSGAITITPATS